MLLQKSRVKKLTKQQQQRIRTRAITNPTEFSAISDRIFTSSPRRSSMIFYIIYLHTKFSSSNSTQPFFTSVWNRVSLHFLCSLKSSTKRQKSPTTAVYLKMLQWCCCRVAEDDVSKIEEKMTIIMIICCTSILYHHHHTHKTAAPENHNNIISISNASG